MSALPNCSRCDSPLEQGDLRCPICAQAIPGAQDEREQLEIEILRCEGCGAAVEYDVHRGTIPAAGGLSARPGNYDHACLGATDTLAFGESDLPGANAFYYLVNARSPCESATRGLGTDSDKVARPIPEVFCP